MEILNKNVGLLSNSEVYSLLKQTKHDLTLKVIKKKNLDANNANLNINVDKHLPTIVYESLRYLEKTPCVNQTSSVVCEFMRKLNEISSQFPLTKIEKLLILNHCPASAVELQCLIEDSEERFSVEQMDTLLDLIQTHLPFVQETAAESANQDPEDHDTAETTSN